ncbi:YraN family protein [Ideonella dechloratans]|uniref:YraN family protein n=1 Tax=Ideonella dechloratans TaxID=36863 RepID=UPI0035AF1C95
MWFGKPRKDPASAQAAAQARAVTGRTAEDRALAHLQGQGLRLVQRNYRVARGPSRRGGEIDLILRERDGTLVFVEVRARQGAAQGGAAASVTFAKQRSLVYAAQHYLMRLSAVPPCRFDVVAIDGEALEWLRGAFDAG